MAQWRALCDKASGQWKVQPGSNAIGVGLIDLGVFPTMDDASAAATAYCKKPPADAGPQPGGGIDNNVGGAPCPPGTHPSGKNELGLGGSGGDSTANTDDAVFGCEPDETSSPGDGSGSSMGDCCDKTAAGLEKIGSVLAEIKGVLEKKLGDAKECNEKCLDEIVEKLRKRFEKGTKSCKECRQMLRNGLGGTLEYAVACAGACIEKAKCECSMGDESCWGEPCEGCGEPCCVCEKGICKPTPCPPDEPKKKFKAWCHPSTASVMVTDADSGPPAPGMYQVALADSEQAAMSQGIANCSQSKPPDITLPDNSPPPIVNGPQSLCDFNFFIEGGAAKQYVGNKAAVNMRAGIAQAFNSIGRIGFEGLNLDTIGNVAKGLSRSLTGEPGFWFDQLLPAAVSAIGCDNERFRSAVELLCGIEAIQTRAGVDLSPWTDQIKYFANMHCRQQFMGPDQAMAAYLANNISYEKLDDHWAIANYCKESVASVVQASKAKPVPLQLAMMRRRGLIDSGGYSAGMRQLGYLESGVAEQLFQLTEQVPTLTDIIRLMVRDADDDGLAKRLNLDAFFTEKYGGQLRKWSEAQGIPEKVAQYAWRAHWNIPAPGQLFTFYQRLRDNAKFGGRDKMLADIKAALVQQDILPFWHDYYLETSFRPLGRVDIRRAFRNGTLSDEELVPAFRQLGYSDANSEKHAVFSRRDRRDSAVGHRAVKLWLKFAISRTEARQRMLDDGLPVDVVDQALSDSEMSFATSPPASSFVRGDLTRQQFTDRLETVGVTQQTASKIADLLALKVTHHPAVKGFAAGAIEYGEASQAMIDFGMSEQVVSNILDGITKEIDYAFLAACQKAIKRRYLSGEFDNQAAQTELVNRGTSVARANKLVENWGCERVAAGKAIPTNKLCDWLGRGVISSAEFVKRLVTLGHSAIDAAIIRDDCLASISAKRQAQAAKEAKDQVALEQRELQAMRRAEAAANREQGVIYRAQQKAASTRQNRQKQELSAAVKVEAKCDCDLGDSLQNVKAQASRAQLEYGLTIDESLQLVIKAAEAWEGGDIATYQQTVTTLALGLAEPQSV